MFITKLQLKNFKRFTDLTIDLTSENNTKSPKLVLLIGTNGSGKSSVFDAFEALNRLIKDISFPFYNASNVIQSSFYGKNTDQFEVGVNFEQSHLRLLQNNNESEIQTNFHPSPELFYGRTAFRYIPIITKSQLGGSQQRISKKFYEEEKDVFDVNIDKLFTKFLDAFSKKDTEVEQKYLDKINSGFSNIFGDSSISLKYSRQTPPIQGAHPFRFYFSKGISQDLDYSLLSAGEKMIFIVLFDLYLNVLDLHNSIIFLDELDLHLNTSLQFYLIKEITENWIPENCQLWVASHSLGFIEYAKESDNTAIIDFDSLDFDEAQILLPLDKDDPNKQYLDVALGKTFLNTLIQEVENKYKNQTLIFSEGENLKFLERAKEIYAPNLPIKFLDGGGKDNLKQIYFAFSTSKTRHIIIFDSGARPEYEKCNIPLNKSIAILIPLNQSNTIKTTGVENLFNANFFDGKASYYEDKIKDGEFIKSLNKKKFCDFILNQKNPGDFINFKSIFEEIESLLV